MNVEFLSKFEKDLDQITSPSVKKAIVNVIAKIESARYASDIPNLKKLKGHKDAFRIKLANYRIGVFINGSVVQMARIVHRKDIYKLFP